jgi:hypothetical protein
MDYRLWIIDYRKAAAAAILPKSKIENQTSAAGGCII